MPNFSSLTVGLILGIFFSVGFLLLGYSSPLSLILGLIGGCASAMISHWSYITEIPNISNPKIADDAHHDPMKFDPNLPHEFYGRRRQRKNVSFFDWILLSHWRR